MAFERHRFLSDKRGMSRPWAIITVLLVIIVSAGLGTVFGLYFPGFSVTQTVRQVFQPPFNGRSSVNILVLGEDNTGIKNKNQRGLSDTIMLVKVDLTNNYVAAVSIPRDTKVDLGGYGGSEVQKINAAYSIGGPVLTEMVVEELTGVRPDYYIKTNVEGFEKCVDIVGGVWIDVEKNMRYTDNWGGLHINLKKGPQLLDGDKAMQYVRFRHDAMGDIWRTQRQQKFLKALARKALSPLNLPKLPQLVEAMRANVETDMTVGDMIALARLPSKMDLNNMKTATLPGAPDQIHGGSYWAVDPVAARQITQELFTPVVPGLPKIEVLNGSGISGAAQKVADALKEKGYAVTEIRNAKSFDYASSQIISHKTDLQGLEQLAGMVNSSAVKYEQDTAAKADVTIIVGKDCLLINSGG